MIATPPAALEPAGVYLHFPFCAVRCSYCDFATVAGRDERIERYLDALVVEIARFQPALQSDVDTVFLGGGTPSRMTPAEVRRLLDAVRERFAVAAGAEVTLEANPESLDPTKLAGYRDAGVTRVSVGVQSLSDDALRRAGRAHDAARALEAVGEVQSVAGLEVNVDLIAGLPGERLAAWDETLERVAQLGTDHVSLYLLETDKETPLARAIRSGRVQPTTDDALAEAYRSAVERFAAAGLELYEISNFARGGRRSRHNLKYWSDASYGGFGLGAHGYAAGERRGNLRDLDAYLARIAAGDDPIDERDAWRAERRLEEALILGLRRVEGVDIAALGARYECDLAAALRDVWESAEQRGSIRRADSRIRLTAEGRLLSNGLFSELIGSLGAAAAAATGEV